MAEFTIHYNDFNGAVISVSTTELPDPSAIDLLIQQLNQEQKSLIWVTLAREQSGFIPLFTQKGFVFHLCNENELTLIFRIQKNAYAPFAPTHTLGVGGLVLNDKAEVLLIRDKWMNGKGFKLPGGYVDLGESLNKAAEREVFEETGIQASFTSIVSVITKHPHNFGKSNAYIVCRLSPSTSLIDIQDTDEIELATWMNPADFLTDDSSSKFHRHLVATLLNKQGLFFDTFNFNDPTSDKEMYSVG